VHFLCWDQEETTLQRNPLQSKHPFGHAAPTSRRVMERRLNWVWVDGRRVVPWYATGTVFIESVANERYLSEAGPDGRVGSIREREGGWTGKNNKPVVSADDDYYNRARWKLVPTGDGDRTEFFIESAVTERYLVETGPDGKVGSIRGREGGWTGNNNKPVVSADADYYNRARWKLVPTFDKNTRLVVGKRVRLMPNFKQVPGKATEGPLRPGDVGELIEDYLTKEKAYKGLDTYQVRFNGITHWYEEGTIGYLSQPDEFFIESAVTERYLFEAGPEDKVGSIRGREGGWKSENNTAVLTADANYYDRAKWKIVPVAVVRH
jgi:hypothetical protein